MVINEINAIIKTLNTITVSGEDNLSKLLGCIIALKSIAKDGEDDAGQTNT